MRPGHGRQDFASNPINEFRDCLAYANPSLQRDRHECHPLRGDPRRRSLPGRTTLLRQLKQHGSCCLLASQPQYYPGKAEPKGVFLSSPNSSLLPAHSSSENNLGTIPLCLRSGLCPFSCCERLPCFPSPSNPPYRAGQAHRNLRELMEPAQQFFPLPNRFHWRILTRALT
jgi:hypothetical protein